MKRKCHFMMGRTIVCGVGNRWQSQQITSSQTFKNVTCKSCINVVLGLEEDMGEE